MRHVLPGSNASRGMALGRARLVQPGHGGRADEEDDGHEHEGERAEPAVEVRRLRDEGERDHGR